MIATRPATPADAAAMSAILTPIIELWGSTRRTDPAQLRAQYIDAPERIACTVAEADGRVVGFQSLQRAQPGNPYDVPADWGVIGTYVALDAVRGGIGAALFAATREAARAAGLDWIDASIGADNPRGLGYYAKMGFIDYRRRAGLVCKRFRVGG